ncbi:MAG: proprotein convertase P-domain-containing protein, partial [Acidobacteriota bacterium]
CSGIRDADYMMHAAQMPWTPQNQGSGGVWDCGGSGSYNGPCGWEDHCESGLSTQALWDFVNRDLPVLCGMDLPTGWQLADRLFYSSMPTLGNMYTCTPPTSNGCNGGSLYATMRAFDDDGDGTANGTPHAAAIYASLARHGIACGAAGDATNQNQTSCPTLTVPTAAVTSGSDSALLTWTSGGAGATRYFVYRNEMNCDAGFTKVATVNAPALAYTDTTVVNGITYYYRVQAAAANDSCVSAMSPCATVTPMPCAGSVSLSKGVVRCTDSLDVTVVDSNVPGSPATLAVEAWSTADGSHKSFTLSNTPPGSATYTGSVTTTASSSPGPSEVRMADGATLTVRYVDADYCGTPSVDVDGEAVGDCLAPVISAVSASVSGQNVTVTWTTDEPADSRVTYGTSVPPSSTGSDAAYGTAHAVTLSALEACQGHVYAVESADPAGNSSTDDNGGAYYTFTTGVTSAPTYTRTETPGLAIPDANPAGVTSVLSVSDDKVILDVNVTLHSITHTYDGDLDIYLISPEGTQVELSTDNGGSGENFSETVLDDEASSSITGGTAPFTGTFRPEGSLSAFDGQSAAGDWGLKVVDDAGSDTGTIDSWSLTFTFPSQSCGAELAFASQVLTDACTGSGGGSGDGVWDAGEEAILAVTAGNVGTSGATAVLGSLSTSTPGILVLVDSASYPDIPSGATGDSDPPHFRVFADPSVACGTSATFSLHMVSDQGAWDDSFSVALGQAVTGSGTVLDEDFGSGIPVTWTVVDGGSGGGTASTWTTSNPGGRDATAPITDPFAIVDSDAADSGATQDEQLITPVLDLSAATSATLEFDHYFYRYQSEVCDVDVRSSLTAGAWENVGRWTGASTANPAHATLDLTSRAAGASDAQVRFRYYNGSFEWYWMVDNVRVEAESVQACSPAGGPQAVKPVPDGRWVAGTAAGASKASGDGSEVDITWDVTTCASPDYNLYWGVASDLASHALSGAACGMGPSGTYAWASPSVPEGEAYTWWVLVGTDGAAMESEWGRDSAGNERHPAASNLCGFTAKSTATTCP